MAQQQNTTAHDATQYDLDEPCILLKDPEAAILAVNALMAGRVPPKGISFSDWLAFQGGDVTVIPCSTFGRLCDALPFLLEDLGEWRTAIRMVER